MSNKIPEAQWAEIAARRAAGEAVASIARSYECSPALVYSVLKRTVQVGQDVASEAALPKGPPERSATILASPGRVNGGLVGANDITPRENESGREQTDAQPRSIPTPIPASNKLESPKAVSRPGQDIPVLQSGKTTALTADLDETLRADAAAAIARFQTAFDAALKAPDVAMLEALRQAASEVMRMGARTTIVVERLASNATASGGRRSHADAHDASGLRPLQSSRALTGSNTPADQPLVAGTVKWFSHEKGFGFVAIDDQEDVFVSLRALQNSGLSALYEGQRVRLSIRANAKGPQAQRIELVGPRDD